MEQQYLSNLTREPYFYYELKQVAKLTLAGFSSVEIRTKIKDENLFQCTTNKGINRLLSATHERVAVLDEIMLNLLVLGSLHTSKLVALIAILKTNRLFSEFVEEVYLKKLRLGEQELELRDFRIFFNNKAEQSAKVAGWQEFTLKKLSQVYSKILFESGLINSKYDFAFNQQIDDRPRGKQDGEMGIQIITPFFDHYSEYGEQEFKNLSFGGDKVVMKLPPDASFWYEMEDVLKIETYRIKTASISLLEAIRAIIDNKTRELKTRKDRVKSLLVTEKTKATKWLKVLT
ncbi:MAG: DUF1819 family protein [Desulfosporosinus sp.]|nr:DUF1819 family protein [Desulfosporosinus sp.]